MNRAMTIGRAHMAMAVLAAVLLAAATGCDREAKGGLPPASEWKAPAPKPSKVEGGRRGKGRSARGTASHQLGASAEDPHAGLEAEEVDEARASEGAAEAAEEGGAEDPHGADPGHGEEADVEERAPRQTVARGEVRASGEAAAAVKPGAVMYVSAVPIDPDSGQPKGSAIAVDRFEVKSLPMRFELSGSRYEGDVVITAWTDGDGEARTREPGDAEGRVRARLPADGVQLVLDKVLR